MQGLEQADARRLEGIGQLAAGVAHEINTPTQYIGDAAHFLRDAIASLVAIAERHQAIVQALGHTKLSPELTALVASSNLGELDFIREEVGPAVDSIIDGAAKIAEIVRAMKALTHFGDGELRPTDITTIIDAAIRMTRYETKRHCTVVYERRELPPVRARASELGQVLVNLIVNARDAIVERAGNAHGRIEVDAVATADHVVIEVADDGVGLPAGAEDRIFTRFFTTKAIGRGTGQGLALVQRVIEQHAGRVSARRRQAGGTIVRIELPIANSGTRRLSTIDGLEDAR